MANRSSNINLYASEDKSDASYRVEFEATQSDFKMVGVQDAEFDFGSYKFKKADDSVFDLETRFAALEADTQPAQNATAITQLQTDLAAEAVSRQAGDLANTNSINAEISARVQAVQAVQDALDVQEAKQEGDRAASDAAIAAEAASRSAAVAAEEAARVAAIAGLQAQITNILSNTDASALDSLSEILSHITSEDQTILAAVASARALADENKARFDELTQDQ